MTNPSKTTLTRVIDGDTVVTQSSFLLFFRSKPLRIRLYGIDAPESDQTGGTESTHALTKIASKHNTKIWLTKIATDQYGRTVGIISSSADKPADHYNLKMLEEGQAHCYMLTGPFKSEYQAAERQAKNRKLGIWDKPGMEPPADFRKRQNARETTTGTIKRTLFIAALTAAAVAAAWYVLADDVRSFIDNLTGVLS